MEVSFVKSENLRKLIWLFLPQGVRFIVGGKLDMNYEKTGLRIRSMRLREKKIQENLAFELGYSPPKISRLENGKMGSGIDRLDTIEHITNFFGITVFELIADEYFHLENDN